MATYAEKLKDPRWQKKRLEVLNRDGFQCRFCGDDKTELQVHHITYYSDVEPWDYHHSDLYTLCKYCHEKEGDFRKSTEKHLTEVMRRKGFSADSLLAFAQFMDKYPGAVQDVRNIIENSINLDL